MPAITLAHARRQAARPRLIARRPGVCGGEACVDGTRLPVWLLVEFREAGLSDAQLQREYPSLTRRHLLAAWRYADRHPQEIAEARRANQRD